LEIEKVFITSQLALLDQLDAIKSAVLDATGPVHATVKLAKGTFVPTPTVDPTTFTEADFDGYSSKTIAAYTSAAIIAGPKAEILASSLLSWTPTGTTTPNTVTGYWIVGGNGDYLGGEAFATGIVLNGPTTTLNLVPVWQVSPATWSGQVLA
jgi:hypothetical protein